MRLMTCFELAQRSDLELAALFREISGALPQTETGSEARRNALASLENINRVRAARLGPS